MSIIPVSLDREDLLNGAVFEVMLREVPPGIVSTGLDCTGLTRFGTGMEIFSLEAASMAH
jgi:hypothetical protein